MYERLTRNEYCWAVDRSASPVSDDGAVKYGPYFTDLSDADREAKRVGGRVVQVTLWEDGRGSYYRCETTRVSVNLPRREEVTAKLTRAEMESLGIMF